MWQRLVGSILVVFGVMMLGAGITVVAAPFDATPSIGPAIPQVSCGSAALTPFRPDERSITLVSGFRINGVLKGCQSAGRHRLLRGGGECLLGMVALQRGVVRRKRGCRPVATQTATKQGVEPEPHEQRDNAG